MSKFKSGDQVRCKKTRKIFKVVSVGGKLMAEDLYGHVITNPIWEMCEKVEEEKLKFPHHSISVIAQGGDPPEKKFKVPGVEAVRESVRATLEEAHEKGYLYPSDPEEVEHTKKILEAKIQEDIYQKLIKAPIASYEGDPEIIGPRVAIGECLDQWARVAEVQERAPGETDTEFRKKIVAKLSPGIYEPVEASFSPDRIKQLEDGPLIHPMCRTMLSPIVRDIKITGSFSLDDSPEETHTFSAELDGELVEMPSPGRDWKEIDREEFVRGDCFYLGNFTMGDPAWDFVVKKRSEEDALIHMDLSTDIQKCWFKEYNKKLFDAKASILSISTWQKQARPSNGDLHWNEAGGFWTRYDDGSDSDVLI